MEIRVAQSIVGDAIHAGVGMTPPKVLGAPKPWSSVMISSTLGAPFGGTTRGAHHGVDSEAFSLITPPNFGSEAAEVASQSIVVVAPGAPGTPVTCCANAETLSARSVAADASALRWIFTILPSKGFLGRLMLSAPGDTSLI